MSRGFPAPFHHKVCSQEIASNEASSLAMDCSPSEDKPPTCTIALLASPELGCSYSLSGLRSHTDGDQRQLLITFRHIVDLLKMKDKLPDTMEHLSQRQATALASEHVLSKTNDDA